MQVDPDNLQASHGIKRLRSEHLYQLSAYVHHHRRAKRDRGSVEGVLLYPLVDEPLDVAVNADGQSIQREPSISERAGKRYMLNC